MKKILILSFLALLLNACTTSFTTVMVPKPTNSLLVTTGDLPNKDYEVLGFIESSATRSDLWAYPSELQISKMKTQALNDGLVPKAEELNADAVINFEYSTYTDSYYFLIFFLCVDTKVNAKGTAIKFK
ncbi:MAG: hypothetical protein KAT68_16425 [Bacteroidales bacterium]|nr:hypothetical protein [Bacteroidales bacterium]